MKKQFFKLLLMPMILVCLALCPVANAANKIKVVTALPDLASITQAIGGDKVEVFSIGKGYQDPHFIPPKPSFIVKLKNAQMLVRVGLGLDIWLDSLIRSSGNPKIYFGAPGYVDASIGIPVLEFPNRKIDRSLGDIHALGNPHYWLDPVNAKYISADIVAGLKRVDPADGAYFDQRRMMFLKELANKLTGWIHQAAPLKGVRVISYHDSWPYFERRFGLKVVGFIEPKPGIPPTPKHTQYLIQLVRQENVKLIMMEPYYLSSTPKMIAAATGAKVIVVPPSVGGVPGANDYFSLFDTILNRLLTNLPKK